MTGLLTLDAKRTSASKLPLFQRCTFSARPEIELPPDEPSEQSRLGTARHTVYAAILERTPITAEMLVAGDITEMHVATVRAWIEDTIPLGAEVIVERAFAYDLQTDTARELPRAGHRDYSQARPGELVGTVDLAWIFEGVLYLRDWKCGRWDRVDPARTNGQLRALGLFVARTRGLDTVDVGPLLVADSGDVADHDHARMDVFDLDGVADELRTLPARVAVSTPVPGTWCAEKYCSLNGHCPAHLEAARNLPTITRSAALAPIPTTAAEAALLVELLPMMEAYVEAAGRGLRAWSDAHGLLRMPNDRLWGARLAPRETVKPTPEALEVLRAHGVGAAIETVSTTSKSAIEDACKAVAEPRKGAAKMREVLAALGKVGALQATQIKTYGYLPKKSEDDDGGRTE